MSNRDGRWSAEEHDKFLKGMAMYGRRWTKVADVVGTRTTVQVRSHAQKWEIKMAKEQRNKGIAAHATVQSESTDANLGECSTTAGNTSSGNGSKTRAVSEASNGHCLASPSSSPSPQSDAFATHGHGGLVNQLNGVNTLWRFPLAPGTLDRQPSSVTIVFQDNAAMVMSAPSAHTHVPPNGSTGTSAPMNPAPSGLAQHLVQGGQQPTPIHQEHGYVRGHTDAHIGQHVGQLPVTYPGTHVPQPGHMKEHPTVARVKQESTGDKPAFESQTKPVMSAPMAVPTRKKAATSPVHDVQYSRHVKPMPPFQLPKPGTPSMADALSFNIWDMVWDEDGVNNDGDWFDDDAEDESEFSCRTESISTPSSGLSGATTMSLPAFRPHYNSFGVDFASPESSMHDPFGPSTSDMRLAFSPSSPSHEFDLMDLDIDGTDFPPLSDYF